LLFGDLFLGLLFTLIEKRENAVFATLQAL
jgi:hypothetical protein